MNQSERFFSFEEAKSKIEYWCSYRDRSEFETIQKLHTYGQTEKDIEKIISYLKEYNFLDDDRFVNSFVSGKFRIKRWGRKKIYAGILSKRVNKETVQKALQSIDEQEYNIVIDELVEKKMRLLSGEKDPWKKKQKILQYVISRGFEYDLVQDILSKKQL
jgi:regulatory protein|tara:strand:+ start:6065 stop:6544 length:480 start_codon:yes stop_codon:yes gene_type:complete